MHYMQSCPCCTMPASTHYPALISPFILHYALKQTVNDVKLLICDQCTFRWFDQRYDEDELARLYQGYRGPAYLKARHKYEPWYTQKANDTMGHSLEEINSRINLMTDFISPQVDMTKVENVLDYGGDKGQFILPAFGKHKYVYEVSGVKPVAGVTSLSSKEILEKRTYDFLMICHVLEHVPDPRSILDSVLPLLASSESYLYIEVPYEGYDLRWISQSNRYAAYLRLFSKLPGIRTGCDFYSTLFRVKYGIIPPLGFIKMHEHINFFTQQSLATLLERAGYNVLRCEIKGKHNADTFGKTLLALAQKKNTGKLTASNYS